MEKLTTVSKQYILLASIHHSENRRIKTLFDVYYKIYPAYIEIEYSDSEFIIHFENQQHHYSYSDIGKVTLSICGRRATIRQQYLLTLHINLYNDMSLEIETFDYEEAIHFYENAKVNKVEAIETNNIISIVNNHLNDLRQMYDLIEKNSDTFFKEHPQDKRRLYFTRSTLNRHNK